MPQYLYNKTLSSKQQVFARNGMQVLNTEKHLPGILFITSYPPRECGIATYSQDLIQALRNKFSSSFTISICPLESESERHTYSEEDIDYTLNTDDPDSFHSLALRINTTPSISMVVIQHEFGFFHSREDDCKNFIRAITKPCILVFHTVLPRPSEELKAMIQELSSLAASVVIMTNFSRGILMNDYVVPPEKITVIPHGTHLIEHADKEMLKQKHMVSGRIILSTFGLLSTGKNIETTLRALPAIVKENPKVLFLIIGKTHPSVIKHDGEQYRDMLEALITELQIEEHVKFINHYVALPVLLEYLQLTDMYLFTSKDPNQAVSGTFSYAIGSGCPIISTPIPHAREVMQQDAGIIIDFENPQQLAEAVIRLLKNEQLRKNISLNGLHRMASTAWENVAIAYALLFETMSAKSIALRYTIPAINKDHITKLTTNDGIVQFSNHNQPDIESGYTLDDNARALIALCQHFELTRDQTDLPFITIYLSFIKYCVQPDGSCLNYVNASGSFSQQQNQEENLEDANGRAVWALGYLISMGSILPDEFIAEAEDIVQRMVPYAHNLHSTRAMAFIIKGLYYSTRKNPSVRHIRLIELLANRLVQMYRHETDNEWQWFESYLTYANSVLPQALLCAWLATGNKVYKEIAQSSFHFLLSRIYRGNSINVISNKHWLSKEHAAYPPVTGGEQPIDVAYTIIALQQFYTVFRNEDYKSKMFVAFNWFLGDNHLHQIMYNPRTGGCYDGLEEHNVNLNQGAESTVSYLMARLTVESSLTSKYRSERRKKLVMS